MYVARYRSLWKRFSKVVTNYKLISFNASVKVPNKTITTPCMLGFSLFTWLGLDKKVSIEDELIHTIKHCVLFIQKEEYEKAEQLLHVVLRQAQQINHQLAITYIYDVMANLAFQREQLDKAKQLFVAVTQRIMANGATEDDPRVVHISAKLARISHLKKEFTTSQLGFDWCLNKLKKIMENDPSDENTKLLALTEDWYGRLFLDCNQNEQGLKLMIDSLNKMKKVESVEKEQIVLQLNDIGTVCDQLGQVDESINYFREAIDLGKSINMEDLGTMHVNLGRAYIKKKLIDAARKSCGFALKSSIMLKNDEVKKEAELCIRQINNMH